ncbi:Uncharacterised protein [Mycobacteroides abscessus subsp. abscessus]|nr:Uncharacterised protein [Mycobacteroides abscessus subsp. abscessus]
MAGIGRPHTGLRRAYHVGSRTLVGPGRAMQPMGDSLPHELVIGRVELDFVDAVAPSVMRVQHRAVPVRQLPGALHPVGAVERAHL